MENPLSFPYFASTLVRVAFVLAGLTIVAVVRDRRRPLGSASKMTTKIFTAAWVALILLTSLFAGGVLFCFIVALVAFQAIREYSTLVSMPRVYVGVLHGGTLFTVVLLAARPAFPIEFLIFGMFLTVALVPIMSGVTAASHRNCSSTVFGYIYIGLGFALLVLVREGESWGLQFLIVAGTATAFADAGGYLLGTWLRGPKLVRSVSPDKTWTGVVGTLLGAAVGVLVQGGLLPESWGWAVLLGMIASVSIGAVLGDLLESSIKRDFGRKDAGGLLAGFGGVLDRFDSYLVAIPASYVVVLIMN